MKNKRHSPQINRNILRVAVANYMESEGCSCCQGYKHEEHKALLAKLLGVPKFKDDSGYDFSRYITDKK